MTTNQKIDGVPREQMISFPRELSDELAELIAEKARVCGSSAFEIWEAICDQFGTQAQPQGGPEAWTTSKPKAPGAYWIRGFNLSGEFTESALVQVALEGDEQVLMVNLHQSTTEKDTAYWYEVGDINSNFEWLGPLHAEQPAPVAVVPDGYCIMPRQLTAENGAKALLLGEFKLLVTKECPECCELEEPVEGCSICDGEGEYGQKHTIPWDQIKFIYSKAVSGLAVKTESAKSR